MCGNSRWRRPLLVNIYLMQVGDSDIFKIGYTSNTPNDRIRVIRYYVPNIKLIDYVFCEFIVEKELHTLFNHKRVDFYGFTEYFKLNKRDLSKIKSIFKKVNKWQEDSPIQKNGKNPL